MFANILKTLKESIISMIGVKTKNIFKNQLDNMKNPFSTCFPTSVSMLLSVIGIKKTPDEITTEINTQKYIDWANKYVYQAWRYTNGNLHYVWVVQKKYIEDLLKINNLDVSYKVIYNNKTNRTNIIDSLISGSPLVINTAPTHYLNGVLSHIMLLTGYNFFGSYIDPKSGFKKEGFVYTIDDPFGDFRNNYKGNSKGKTDGDDVLVLGDEFDNGIRGNLSLSLRRI